MRAVTPSTVLSVLLACGLVLAGGIAAASVAGDVASANGQPSSSAVSSVSSQSNNTTTVTITVSPSTTASSDSSTTTTTQPANYTERLEREVEMEFLNCSAVRLTGNGNHFELDAHSYYPGLATYILNVGPVNGTEVVDVDDIWYSPWGMTLDGVSAGRHPTKGIYADNPTLSECREQSKPDKPTLNVSSAQRINESAVEVTFQYHNPNSVELRRGSGLDGRVTSGETPYPLKPGNHSFTVVWQPVNESARLTWTVGLTPYGRDPVSASTRPAGAIGESSADGDGNVSVEFLNCSAFRVTGQADELEVSTSAYNPSIDTHLHSYGPINGTEVIDPDSFRDASRGVVTRAVAAYIGPDSNPSARNPNISECMEKIKPDKPTLDVTSVERINESAVSVTFQYHNPNEGKLPNGGGFDGRVTTGRTPDSLRPGSHSFSVVWRPVNESARLTWLVGLVELGYNETVVTMTPPAGSIGDSSDETSSTTTRMATSPTTTPRSTTTTATTSSTSDESSSASGSSSGESAPTTTRQSQQTTTTTPEPTTTILTTEITSATETPTTSRTATPTHSPTPTMASSESANATTNVQADPSEPGGGGTFARIDSSTAIQGGSLAVATVFAVLAFVAWRRR